MAARRTILTMLMFVIVAPAWGQSRPAGVLATTPQAVPNPALQARARDMIHSVFKEAFAKKSPADRMALAKILLQQSKDTADDAVARYVALVDALDLSANAGDAVTACAAIAELARLYTVDPLELQRQNLWRANLTAAGAEQCESVARLAIEAANAAATIDAFDAVQELTALAETAGNKTQQLRVVASLQVPLANLHLLIDGFAQVKAAYARLDKNPDDSDAHLTVGRFYAFYKNQWSLGLPHLARGSDEMLRALARSELTPPATDAAEIALADAWWELAEKANGLTRQNLSAHARQWYANAQARITGITLSRIKSRLENDPTSPTATTLAAPAAPLPQGLDLLALIDPARDTAQGRWSRTAAGELACESSGYAVIQIPRGPPNAYDLVVSFTRTEGSGPVALLLCAHGHAFDFALDVKGEARFERVDGKIARDNPTSVPVTIANNHRYELTLEVRADGVRALLDGKPLTEWKTDGRDLSRYAVWKIADTALCGLGANNAAVTFHAARLREVTGLGAP